MKGDSFFFSRISVDRFGVTGTLAGYYLSSDVDVYGILLVRPRFIYLPPQKHTDRNRIIFVIVRLIGTASIDSRDVIIFFSRSKNTRPAFKFLVCVNCPETRDENPRLACLPLNGGALNKLDQTL